MNTQETRVVPCELLSPMCVFCYSCPLGLLEHKAHDNKCIYFLTSTWAPKSCHKLNCPFPIKSIGSGSKAGLFWDSHPRPQRKGRRKSWHGWNEREEGWGEPQRLHLQVNEGKNGAVCGLNWPQKEVYRCVRGRSSLFN